MDREALQAALESAARQGWAELKGNLDAAVASLESLGAESEPGRAGLRASTLVPLAARDARPRSLSARYGLAELPLHSDGAHLADPHDYLILDCLTSTEVPTLIWPCQTEDLPAAAATGIFLVGRGRSAFYAQAITAGGALRYDPGCMWPRDDRAREAAAFFAERQSDAERYVWRRTDRCLVIDNRRCLHGRGEAIGAGARRLRRVTFSLQS
jgi:alpha-ketoglutarate-dependent taurine dioxygenase